jgi:hypothetical protein
MFLLEQEHAKEEKREIEKFWHFGRYVSEDSNMLQNTRKCGSQKITSFNAVEVKKRTKCWKNRCLRAESFSITF